MKTAKRSAAISAIAFAVTASAAPQASAVELRYASGSGPNTIGSFATDIFQQNVEEYSDGAVTSKTYALSLLNLLEMTGGVREGIADLGVIAWPYFLSEFPLTNLVSEASSVIELSEGDAMQATYAYIGALSEYLMIDCAACIDEARAQNQLLISAVATSPYVLHCTRPVTNVDDFAGLRLRAGGAWWTRWANAMGATAVSLSSNETLEALSQGVIDCTASSAGDLTNFGYLDAATDVTVGAPGSSFAFAMGNINLDTWRSLDEAQRKAVLRAGADVSGRSTDAYFVDARENLEQKAPARDIAIHDAHPDLLAKSKAWIEEDLGLIADSYQERFGIEDASARLDRLRALMGEWMPRMQGVTDGEGLSEVLWEHVHSRVDVMAYGE